jgi:hypothetical protein
MCRILEVYEQALGQRLNNDKNAIFFSRNMDENTRTIILQIVGVPTSQRYDKYLGLLALVGRSQVWEFQILTKRVGKRVSDWKRKFLSQAGKEIMLKAVIQAIPTYNMSIFLHPKELCKDMNR